MAGPRFSILPIEVLKDTRLTARDLRVLIALHGFKDQAGHCWPSRGLLAALTGLPERRITNVTTRLAALGWLSKEGNGGRSRSCRYRLGVPETVTRTVTVSAQETVPKAVTVSEPETVTDLDETVTDSVTKTVTDLVTGIEQTMNIPENKPLSCAESDAAKYQVAPRAGNLAESFERFWTTYPKKRNKGDAMKAWRALKPGEELVTAILAAVERAKASVQWRKDEGQFIPYPASWLRARGWEDEERVDIVPLPEKRGEKGRIASSVAALQTLFGANDGKANDGKADLPAGNGVPRRRLRG
ncbi:MAG TPA: helix-turn-helix domain-containing protein [Acidiferrobacterales bacterium]|nr:helix-turn-helix domain-containing protein [Acidiferrobacterales bacterium]